MSKVITTSDLLLMFNIGENKDSERIVAATLALLSYLPENHELHTSTLKFVKLSDDVISIKRSVTALDIVDDLKLSKIIKLPI